MTLEDQILICLEIMAGGEPMLRLGEWEKPLEEAEKRGWVEALGGGRYRLTVEGRKALEAEDAGE